MEAESGRVEELETVAREAAAAAKAAEGVAEALRKVAKVSREGRNIAIHAGEELDRYRKLGPALARFDGKAVMARVEPVVAAMEAEASAAAEREIVRLLGTLEGRLKALDQPLSGHYPELTCGVLTIAIEKGARDVAVSIYYGPRIARMATIQGSDVEQVAAGVTDAYKELETALLPDDEFLPALRDAWRLARMRRGESPDGGNAPILSVLAELCFARQTPQFLRNPVRSAFAPYGQTALSYQLFTLRSRRVGDQELTLGIATREEVKSRSSLWVPRNRNGEGVHYASLGFRRNP